MKKRYWWQLTDEEAERLNPPIQDIIANDDNGDLYESVIYHPDWQPVGYIPSPRTRFGWFVYHLIHGLAMRYPWWKVIGFALANTKPEEIDMTGALDDYGDYLRQYAIDDGPTFQVMSFQEFVEWHGENGND